MTLSAEFSPAILRLEKKKGKEEHFLIAAFDDAQGNHLYFWAPLSFLLANFMLLCIFNDDCHFCIIFPGDL